MGRTLTITTLTSCVSLGLSMTSVGCNGEERTAPPPAEAEPGSQQAAATPKPQPTAEVEEVEEEPGRFYGRTVTLSGEIENVRSNTAFELEGDDWLFDDELLVLTKSPVRLGGDDLENMDVIVTGKIVRMVVADVERELGLDLDPQIEMEFEKKPVLIAQSIRAVDEVARWSESEAPEGEIVSMWMLYTLPTPEALAGRRVSFESVTVQSKTGDAIWVGESHGAQILVAPGEGTDLSQLQVGDPVALTGTLQRMPAAQEALAKWKIDPSLRQQVEEEMLYIDAESVKPAEKKPATTGVPPRAPA